MTILTKEPKSLVAGAAISWTKYLKDYKPEDGWLLTYNFLSPTGLKVSITGTDNADSKHLLRISSAVSATFVSPEYYFQAIVSRTGSPLQDEIYSVGTGVIEILKNYSTSTIDPRSHNKRMLDAIETLLEGKSLSDASSYSIGNRSLTKYTPEELLKWHGVYNRRYKIEQARTSGLPIQNKIKVMF
jgi:hypothetical protein